MLEIVSETLYALRQLLKHPTSLAMAVISIAIGIGANTAVFSVVDAFLLRDLPGKEPERYDGGSLLAERRCGPGLST